MARKKNWMPFREAREYVRSLGLKGFADWCRWVKTSFRPKDIPTDPAAVYADDGWINWGDWLGTGAIAPSVQSKKFLPFKIARLYVKGLGLKNLKEWRIWAKSTTKPQNIPTDPAKIYGNKGWAGMGDWLGTGSKKASDKKFLSFEVARAFVRSLKLKGKDDWARWAKSSSRPEDIPAGPSITYAKKGWAGWGDWLGTGTISLSAKSKLFLPFEDARIIVRALGLKNIKEWREWAKSSSKPKDIPANPAGVYAKEGWIGWGDWLGTGTISPSEKSKLFLPFEDARIIVRALGLKNIKEWREWAKSSSKPKDIPANPAGVYAKEGWIGWGDWLGTGAISTHNREHRLFAEARIFVRALGLKNIKEWRTWAKSSARPQDIPAGPERVYRNNGWINMGDWLGTGMVAVHKRNYKTFIDARDFARSLGFKSQQDWQSWAKTSARPNDIPADPRKVYKNKGWINMGDWLGIEAIANQNRKFRSFDDARTFVRSLGFKNSDEWRVWAKSSARPKNVPANPNEVYKNKGWLGMGDWLGTGTISPSNKNKRYLAFEEARNFVRALGLKNRDEWQNWAKSAARPKNIPANPYVTYKAKGWKGMGDWLGTEVIATQNREFRSFDAARIFSRMLKFTCIDDWKKWAKSDERPIDIPCDPYKTYASQGWISWADWLGYEIRCWSRAEIRRFVADLIPHLHTFSQADLYVIAQAKGLLDTQGCGKDFVKNFVSGKLPKKELEKFANQQPSVIDELFNGVDHSFENAQNDELLPEHLSEMQVVIDDDGLPVIETKDMLAGVGSLIGSSCDEQTVEYLIKSKIACIWRHAFVDESDAYSQASQYNGDNVYANEVKNRFLSEYKAAKKLEIPKGYVGKYRPKLMQLYTMYLVKTRKRIGNWSGTGAGKTLSAILSSRAIAAKITIICCPNNVIQTWIKDLKEWYAVSDSAISVKTLPIHKTKLEHDHTYIILNYEFFQQPRAENKLKEFLDKYIVDFVVIDEVHYSKQRVESQMSRRLQVIAAFLSEASITNENIHVLGMSATPVINNLLEGKALLELITGIAQDGLNTRYLTIDNCVALYKQLVLNGIRDIPQYSYQLNEHIEYIDCSELLPEIRRHKSYAELEAILAKVKIPYILNILKSGPLKTIIYTHFIQDILQPLRSAIEKQGWRVAVFTGDEKDSLENDFIKGNADVLIASSCVGAGIDGLQKVCNRVIINSLPWTSADYEQLKGRVYRPHQFSDHVDIFIPLTYADINGERWSWCESRWGRIQWKKSVADAAVDGVIPEGRLRTPAQAHKDVMLMLERLDRGEINQLQRRKIVIPLLGDALYSTKRRLGDLTSMNQKINRESSNKTHQKFCENPGDWEIYHATYREERKDWPIIPYEEAIKWLVKRPLWVVGDFGCGEALLAKELKNQVHSFDHIAINDNVFACDMAQVPLANESLDAVIFSLSLMGSNYVDYLREAHRCLKLDGHLWIAEATSRISDIAAFTEMLERLGFDVLPISKKWKFTFIRAIKTDREINDIALTDLLKNKKVLV